MSNYRIIKEIDKIIETKGMQFLTPVEANSILEKKGMLKDDIHRPGKPLRNLLRKGLIPHAFQINTRWHIPHSKNYYIDNFHVKEKNKHNKKEQTSLSLDKKKENKLEFIRKLLFELIKYKFNEAPKIYLEHKKDWMVSIPGEELIKKHPIISEVYSNLVDNSLILKEQVSMVNDDKLNKLQIFDVWVDEPFNFAIEFDEKQHFNQYRLLTLKHYGNFEVGFDVERYIENCKDVVMKPGKSGFQKLKSNDILFPNFYDSELQDNRIRQRAFRDFLKDFLPIINKSNPTIRIPYHLTNKVIKNFSEVEISLIEGYLKNLFSTTDTLVKFHL